MASALTCAICVILCAQLVSAQENCFVMAPNVFRLGTKETVAVMVDGGPKKVTVMLHNIPSRLQNFFYWSGTVNSDSPQITDIIVRENDVPDLQYEPNNVYVTLEVSCGTQWTKATQVLVSPASGEHFFLQTEKPIYHPGKNVNIRFLAVDGKLKPSESIFRLEVRNPQNVIVERTEFQPSRDLLLTHTYQLPERTLLGEWSLVVKYGYNFQQNTTSTFLVDKYVLPRFKVVLSVPEYVTSNFSTLHCRVLARFANKNSVQGVVLFNFGLKQEVGDVWWFSSSKSPVLLEAGVAAYNLRREHLEPYIGNRLDTLFASHGRLVVKATVTEEATGAKESAQSDKTVFSKTPYVISLRKNQRSFKPGLKIYIIAEVTYVSGNPAPNVPMKVIRLKSNQTYKATTQNNGVATFLVPTTIEDDTLSIQVATDDGSYPYDHQAREQLTLQSYQSVSDGFIAIERKDPKSVVEANQSYEAVLFSHQFDKISSSVYYVVLSKGRILTVQKLPPGRRIEQNIVIPVTPEMTPSFRVVVFAVLGRHVVTDSIYVNAQPACTNTSHFTLGRKNLGAASEPMALETLVVQGTPGTLVGLLGVDQALYLLRKKDLLTRDKLFQSLDSKDLGCGAGGGTNAVEALSSSGVVLITRVPVGNPLRSDVACHEHRRRKREAAINILEEYENETLRMCCSRGQRPDRFLRPCSKRVEILMMYMEQGNTHVRQECVDAFKRCCELREGFGVMRSAGADIEELSDELLEGHTEVREDFRETWLFHTIAIGADGRAEFAASLPSSITTWEVSAVSVSPSGGVCAADPIEILATKKFFVEVNVPYSVIKNEQIEIPATVYNYGARHVEAKVMLLGTNDICSGAKLGKPSAIRQLSIPPGRGRTAIFPVVPLAAGMKYIHVKASSSSGESDAVKVELNVLPPGITKTRSFAVVLDPRNSQGRSQRHVQDSYTEILNANGTQLLHIKTPHPDYALPNTEHCEIDIVGDGVGAVLETVIKHPGEENILPSDCGEQATSKLVPALYAYEYFKTTNRISASDEYKTLEFTRRGYNQILRYRKNDGSFSVFQDDPSSFWLTAYVVRTLCQARKAIMIDEFVITSGLRYIASKQSGDGEFTDKYSYYHRRLVGDLQHRAALTAYVLITLEECDAEGFRAPELSKQRAAAFVERHVRQGDSPGGLALAAYALSLANSRGKQIAIQWLQESVHSDQDKGESHVPETNEVLSAQATSYAIMTFIKERKDSDYIRSFVQWLSKRMSLRGSLRSSQDTVMALQALAKYAVFAKENSLDLSCEVKLSNNRDFNVNVRIKRDNATILNKIEITRPGEKIFVNVKGSGTGILYFNYTYNAQVPDDICKFNITANFEEKQLSQAEILTRISRSIQKKDVRPRSNLKPNYHMEVCASPLADPPDGMVIFEVGLLTGFKPNLTDLENLIRDKRIDAYNLASRKIDLYVPSISRNTTTCVNFSLEQEFNAGSLQSSYVKVYAYYDPDFSCERFYTPDKSSPLLKFSCDQEDVCTCAEGGCPPAEPLDQFIKNKNGGFFEEEDQHERLREFACDEVDYAWSGNATWNTSKDGFIEVTFHITQVLKPGQEDELEDKIRRIKVRDNCAALSIPNGEQYIIMGKDSTYVEEDEFKEKQFMYLIDSSSLIFPARRKYQRKHNRLVAWFINEFSNEATRCFS
ncbi:A.superbus venom factor 1-like [Dermacentor albipictus]|uniref:A.superbus venom factor 1-like n=1 Tax=Dermacentor albipictus TaxID=60249 RepID=UPI0038FC22FA